MFDKITKEQCNALIHFPDENVITKRKLNKSELKGLYKKLLKECNQLYATKSSIQKVVMETIKPTLSNVDTIDTRIHNFKIMKKYLSMISPCIVTSKLTSHILALVKKDKGRFEDVIYFNKQIGSDSEFGVAYLNTGVGEGSRLVFSTKITTEKHKNEIVLLEKMSYAVQHHITPNFPIIYKVLHCKDVKEKQKQNQSDIDINGIDDIIKNTKYYVILNELANGDLNNFLEKKNISEIEYESVLFQVLISLRAFHIHTDHIHNDAHMGNFLYHEIEKGGYWHYKYNNTNIYVPNTGYLVVIWDPGLAHKIDTDYRVYIDYHRIYRILKGYYENGTINLPEDFFIQLTSIIKYIIMNNNIRDKHAIMKYLEKKPKFKHILFSPPLNSHIINETPYYL